MENYLKKISIGAIIGLLGFFISQTSFAAEDNLLPGESRFADGLSTHRSETPLHEDEFWEDLEENAPQGCNWRQVRQFGMVALGIATPILGYFCASEPRKSPYNDATLFRYLGADTRCNVLCPSNLSAECYTTQYQTRIEGNWITNTSGNCSTFFAADAGKTLVDMWWNEKNLLWVFDQVLQNRTGKP